MQGMSTTFPQKTVPTPCDSSLAKQPRSTRLYLLSSLLAVASLSAFVVDIQVSHYFSTVQESGLGDLRRIVMLFEAFAHGGGVAVILLAVASLDPQHRRAIPRLAACAFGAGLLNNLCKVLVGRTRPSEFWSTSWPDSVSQTFVGLMPAKHAGWSELFERSVQSFPSGHSAVAAGLAVGLASLYPQGRWFFAFLAAMAMLQRVASGAHFPSDVLAGAAVGVLFAGVCQDRRLLGYWFNRWEKRGAAANCVADASE